MSIDINQIDERLTSVEHALVRVQQKIGLSPLGVGWVERISGSLADLPEDDYQAFLNCCRTVRTEASAEEPWP